MKEEEEEVEEVVSEEEVEEVEEVVSEEEEEELQIPQCAKKKKETENGFAFPPRTADKAVDRKGLANDCIPR